MTTDLRARSARTLRQDVTSSAGYAIQPSAGMVKLDAMENPFGLPSALKRALGERLAEVAINRYPVNKGEVAAALAQHFEVPAGCKLMAARVPMPAPAPAAATDAAPSAAPSPTAGCGGSGLDSRM